MAIDREMETKPWTSQTAQGSIFQDAQTGQNSPSLGGEPRENRGEATKCSVDLATPKNKLG